MLEKELSMLQILTYGNPVLREKAEEIKKIDTCIVELTKKMVQTMHAAPGIGLAAPQVNQSIRLITIDLSVGENAHELIVLINPEIISQEGSVNSEEACLSVPGFSEKVNRPNRISVKGIDLDERELIIEAEGLKARAFCHEIDHLNGRLFIDHLSLLKRNLIKKKLKKAK